MEPNQEGERDEAGTDPLLEEQAGKGYGAGRPDEESEAPAETPSSEDDG